MTGTPPITRQDGKRKTKVGHVVSDRMDKTIVVSVARLARHPLYKRVIRLTTKFKAHDEDNDAHVGDTVLIEESRPLSATKRWRLVEVVARAGAQAGESIVAEEEATSEAIHAAAHPGRHQPAAESGEAETATGAGTEAGGDGKAGKTAETGEAEETRGESEAAEASR
jgi:small subunit ribosomal protein S17